MRVQSYSVTINDVGIPEFSRISSVSPSAAGACVVQFRVQSRNIITLSSDKGVLATYHLKPSDCIGTDIPVIMQSSEEPHLFGMAFWSSGEVASGIDLVAELAAHQPLLSGSPSYVIKKTRTNQDGEFWIAANDGVYSSIHGSGWNSSETVDSKCPQQSWSGLVPSRKGTYCIGSIMLEDEMLLEPIQIVLSTGLVASFSLRNENGTPIRTARIRGSKISSTGEPLSMVPDWRSIDVMAESALGQFCATGLTPGPWAFVITSEGLAKSDEIAIELPSSAQALDSIPIVLSPPGAIYGTVTGQAGEAVIGAYVRVRYRTGKVGIVEENRHYTNTDENGEFQLTGLNLGLIELQAWRDFDEGAWVTLRLGPNDRLGPIILRL